MAWTKLNLVLWMGMATACKTIPKSDLAATPAQKTKLKTCIVKTVKEAFGNPAVDDARIQAFADELISRAPAENDSSRDYAFENYVDELGCNPRSETASGTFGTIIVGEWAISPFNPENPAPEKR